ncbi:MAG: TetR/AcrR family transcriptional regulator [Actinomycetota bacterium]
MATTRDRILDAARDLLGVRGFASTTVDSVLERAGVSKGAFFHHFPSKAALGRAVVERYAAEDAALLEELMGRAEATWDDPARQLVGFIRSLEGLAVDIGAEQPACLFVSFIYERDLADDDTDEVVRHAVLHWRERIQEKLEQAAGREGLPPVDLTSLADQVFTTVEGALLLARALDDPSRMQAQLAHLRHYLELLFHLPVDGM